jgi:hypothetical protein
VKSALRAALPWGVWATILVVMRRMSEGRYHPPVGQGELSRGRTWLVVLMVVILFLIFTPIPLREVIL